MTNRQGGPLPCASLPNWPAGACVSPGSSVGRALGEKKPSFIMCIKAEVYLIQHIGIDKAHLVGVRFCNESPILALSLSGADMILLL